MGKYHYDESGNMASMFVITFLSLVLIPLSLSFSPFSRENKVTQGCQCGPCQEQRASIRKREKGSVLNPKLGLKSAVTLAGWALLAFLAYQVATSTVESKIYNPFEILGLRSSSSEKEIRSHYKKLSRQYHPDKVKISGNDTAESVATRFVDFTKAYKALTDETIRENLLKFGHPDGQQETSMGIALPQWIIEGHNNIWVLAVYGLVFGIGLPMLLGRWWFGSQQRTKDGVQASTAAAFFKSLKEESSIPDVVGALSKAAEWDAKATSAKAAAQQAQLDALEEQIQTALGAAWTEVRKLADVSGESHWGRKRALVLLYAHLLRLHVEDSALLKEQTSVVLQTPFLLNALLQISLGRNWLAPSLAVMRLHAYFTQALPPRNGLELAQLPRIGEDDAKVLRSEVDGMGTVVERLNEKGDGRAEDVKKALDRWGRVELVDAAFKVIDERIVTPSSIVYLVVKLRLKSPTAPSPAKSAEAEDDIDAVKRRVKSDDQKDYAFLTNPKADAEELPAGDSANGWAHAPYWPALRKAGWWLMLADDKLNRVVVPPMKISEVPFSEPGKERDYRSYKLQFQAPQGVGVYTWKLYVISDTFVGEGVEHNIVLKIDDPETLTADERGAEDEISDPEEDSLAGQMAALRGGAVKPIGAGDEESDEESGTDDDDESGSDSSSDSD